MHHRPSFHHFIVVVIVVHRPLIVPHRPRCRHSCIMHRSSLEKEKKGKEKKGQACKNPHLPSPIPFPYFPLKKKKKEKKNCPSVFCRPPYLTSSASQRDPTPPTPSPTPSHAHARARSHATDAEDEATGHKDSHSNPAEEAVPHDASPGAQQAPA